MIRSSAILAALVALSTAACASPASNEAAATNGAAVSGTTSNHRQQVLACEAAIPEATDTVTMISANAQFFECLKAANTAAVPVIERILQANGSSTAGGVGAALMNVREYNGELCEELDKASPNFGGSLQRVDFAGCLATSEHFLAKVIDDMVEFDGVEPTYLEEARSAHGACYAAYDQSDARSTTEMANAQLALADCVGRSIAPLANHAAERQVANDASFGPIAKANARVAKALQLKIETATSFCQAIAEAGENGIGQLSRVSAAGCIARVNEEVYAALESERSEP